MSGSARSVMIICGSRAGVVRNRGYHQPREVTTAAEAVMARQPRVNDKRTDEVLTSVSNSQNE
jgi:hypothetical protein